MAQILVQGLDERIVERLKKRAKAQGRSVQAEVRMLIEQSVRLDRLEPAEARRRLEEFANRIKGRRILNSVKLIREGRDQ